MPNEKIKHVESGYTLPSEPGGNVTPFDRTTTATVHWYPDQEVVLEVDASGERMKFLGSDAGNPIGEPFGSLAIPLARAEINRLIKALRRARDAAYGRDE